MRDAVGNRVPDEMVSTCGHECCDWIDYAYNKGKCCLCASLSACDTCFICQDRDEERSDA